MALSTDFPVKYREVVKDEWVKTPFGRVKALADNDFIIENYKKQLFVLSISDFYKQYYPASSL